MIYFIRSESGHVKIGYIVKHDVKKRRDDLQVGCPYKLTVLKVIDGTVKLEVRLQGKFKKYHFRGEWFVFSPELRKFISKQIPAKKPGPIFIYVPSENKRLPIDTPKKRTGNHLKGFVERQDEMAFRHRVDFVIKAVRAMMPNP